MTSGVLHIHILTVMHNVRSGQQNRIFHLDSWVNWTSTIYVRVMAKPFTLHLNTWSWNAIYFATCAETSHCHRHFSQVLVHAIFISILVCAFSQNTSLSGIVVLVSYVFSSRSCIDRLVHLDLFCYRCIIETTASYYFFWMRFVHISCGTRLNTLEQVQINKVRSPLCT